MEKANDESKPLKRAPELRGLSTDHHHGLMLALFSKRAAAGSAAAVEEQWKIVEHRFAEELEPHFRIEEEYMVPVFAVKGEHALCVRLSEDHASLRAAALPGAGRSGEDLLRFAEMLENHIRFEERVLFEEAQALFTGDELKALAEACERIPRGGSCAVS